MSLTLLVYFSHSLTFCPSLLLFLFRTLVSVVVFTLLFQNAVHLLLQKSAAFSLSFFLSFKYHESPGAWTSGLLLQSKEFCCLKCVGDECEMAAHVGECIVMVLMFHLESQVRQFCPFSLRQMWPFLLFFLQWFFVRRLLFLLDFHSFPFVQALTHTLTHTRSHKQTHWEKGRVWETHEDPYRETSRPLSTPCITETTIKFEAVNKTISWAWKDFKVFRNWGANAVLAFTAPCGQSSRTD